MHKKNNSHSNRHYLILLIGLILCVFSKAFAKEVTVISEEAYVFSDADFDAETVAIIPGGSTVQLGEAKGYFFKVKLPDGKVGYIADADLSVKISDTPKTQPPFAESAKKKPEAKKKKETESKSSALIPNERKRYLAFFYEGMNFQENTQGSYRTSQQPFFGLKYLGNNTLFSGDIYTDTTISYSNQGPDYYKSLTGTAATADIIFADFVFLNPTPRLGFLMTYFGLGPMIKYSHIFIAAPGGKVFTADDFTIGAVFSLGASLHFKKILIRPEVRYYWEKARSTSLGLSLGYAL